MDIQHKRISSSAVLIENASGELLIVKANYKDYWAPPGGIVDENETPRQAAIREVHEEVGLNLDPTTLVFVSVADRISQAAHTYQFVFRAALPTGTIVLQMSELDEFDFVSKGQVLAADRRYAKAIWNWAHGITGYVEQTFDRNKEGLE